MRLRLRADRLGASSSSCVYTRPPPEQRVATMPPKGQKPKKAQSQPKAAPKKTIAKAEDTSLFGPVKRNYGIGGAIQLICAPLDHSEHGTVYLPGLSAGVQVRARCPGVCRATAAVGRDTGRHCSSTTTEYMKDSFLKYTLLHGSTMLAG